MAQFRDFDIVFCRNVLIYFDDEAKKKVIGALFDSLAAGGYLVLGPSDSLHNISDAFQRSEYSVYNFYRKPDAEGQTAKSATRVVGRPVAKTRSKLSPAPAPASVPSSAALPGSESLRLKILIQRLDRGIRDLSSDVDTSLSKTIEAVGSVTDTLSALSEESDLAPNLRAQLRTADRQLMRVLLFL